MPSGDPGQDVTIRYKVETKSARGEMIAFSKESRAAAQELKASMAEGRAGIKQVGEEIGVNLNRHLISFVAKLPGVGPLMAAAFPIAAVVGIGMALVESGKKLTEFIAKNREVAGAIGEGMLAIQRRTDASNDELQLTNARLDEQIAKLEHKPANGLAVALYEARVETNKLVESLDTGIEAMGKLLKEHSVGLLGSLITNQMPTGGAQKMVQGYLDALQELDYEEEEKVRAAKNADEQSRVRAEAEIDRQRQIAKAVRELRDAYNFTKYFTAPNSFQDQSARLTILGTAAHQFESMGDSSALMNDKTQKTGTVAILQAKKESDELLAQETRKAQEAQMKSFEQGLIEEEAAHGKSALVEYNYWNSKIGDAQKYRDNYYKVIAHTTAALDALGKQSEEAARQRNAREEEIGRQMDERDAEDARRREKRIELGLKLASEEAKGRSEDAKAAYQSVDESTADAVQSGEISPSQRIAELQSALRVETQSRMAALQAEVAAESHALDQYKDLLGEGSDAYQQMLEANRDHLQQNLNEQAKLQAEAQKEMAKLQAEAMRAGIGGAIDDLKAKATDLNGQLKEIIESTVSTLNDDLLKMMTEKPQNRRGMWKDTGKSIFSGLAKTGLQDAEGSLLKAVGLGGAGKMGTQGNPMWTRSADPIAAGVGSMSSSLTAGLGGAGQNPGGLGGFLPTILGLAGMMADGGPVSPGNYLVGERGPELLRIGGSGYVHNNSETRSMMRGGGDKHEHHYHIDARGSHDPAAVNRQITRALSIAGPQIAASAIAATREMKARRPASYTG